MWFATLAVASCCCSLSALNAWTSVPHIVSLDAEQVDPNLVRFDVYTVSPQVLKASTYLSSFAYSRPLTLRGFLVALAMEKLKRSKILQLLALIILGAIPLLGRITLTERSPAEMFEKYFGWFAGLYSIGIFSSIADFVHHVRQRQHYEDDACVEMQRAKHLPKQCALTLADVAATRPKNAAYVKLVYPEPFLPALFPKLCMGWGGLQPMQNTHVSQNNLVVAELMNRLAGNLLTECEAAAEGSKTPRQLFTFERDITTIAQLVTALPGISLFFSKNASSFGAMLCVKQEPGNEEYKQIPVAFPGRTCIRDPYTGKQLSILSYHSSLIMCGSKDCPLGEFRIQFFLGPDGWTGWKTGDEYIKPWAPLISGEELSEEHKILACEASTVVSCAVNLASKTQNLASGGYALHGTCVDSTAICKAIVFGPGFLEDFPLVTSGDARGGVIAACVQLLRALPNNNVWARPILNRVKTVVGEEIPDDTSILPRDMAQTLERFEKSLMGEFNYNTTLRQELKEVKKKWSQVMSEE